MKYLIYFRLIRSVSAGLMIQTYSHGKLFISDQMLEQDGIKLRTLAAIRSHWKASASPRLFHSNASIIAFFCRELKLTAIIS